MFESSELGLGWVFKERSTAVAKKTVPSSAFNQGLVRLIVFVVTVSRDVCETDLLCVWCKDLEELLVLLMSIRGGGGDAGLGQPNPRDIQRDRWPGPGSAPEGL